MNRPTSEFCIDLTEAIFKKIKHPIKIPYRKSIEMRGGPFIVPGKKLLCNINSSGYNAEFEPRIYTDAHIYVDVLACSSEVVIFVYFENEPWTRSAPFILNFFGPPPIQIPFTPLSPIRQAIISKDWKQMDQKKTSMLGLPKLDEYKQSPLHIAVLYNMADLVKCFIEDKISVNIRDGFGETPLHWAIRIKNHPMAKFLIELGAIETIENLRGESPLSLRMKMLTIENK